jgi:phospholipase/lecithinase/hemolysin
LVPLCRSPSQSLCPRLAGYSNLFVFGDSLSDSGNNFIALQQKVTLVPISGNSFIPIFPYASEHYTNAQVWAQLVASSLGLGAAPSLLGGTDYAFGGAQTGPLTPNPFPDGLLDPFPPSLETQAAFFLSQHGPMIPGDALYVVEGGGNNVQAALDAAAGCNGDPICISGIIRSTTAGFVGDIKTIDSELETAGAKNILVWDVPNIGATPAVLAEGSPAPMLGTTIASVMNQALSAAIGMDPDVKLFDIFGLMNDAIADPGAFGLSNVTDACAQFTACIQDPSTFLFWDGIHPTSATEAIISDAILSLVVPEPSTLALLAGAFLVLAAATRLCSGRPKGLPLARE